MSRKGTPAVEKPLKLQDLPHTEVAARAADAMVRLFLEGKKLEPTGVPQALWRLCKLEADGGQVRPFFISIIQGPAYKKLLDIKMRRVTLSSVEDIVFLKDLCRDITKLAGDALLEDLLIHPERIAPKDKQQIFKDAGVLYEKLTPKPKAGEGGPEALEPGVLEGAVLEQAAEFEDVLSRLPDELRERRIRQWKLDEMNNIREREKELLGLGQPTGETGTGVR